MIICHCQNITDHDINAAIDWMRSSDGKTIITPGKSLSGIGEGSGLRRLHTAFPVDHAQ